MPGSSIHADSASAGNALLPVARRNQGDFSRLASNPALLYSTLLVAGNTSDSPRRVSNHAIEMTEFSPGNERSGLSEITGISQAGKEIHQAGKKILQVLGDFQWTGAPWSWKSNKEELKSYLTTWQMAEIFKVEENFFGITIRYHESKEPKDTEELDGILDCVRAADKKGELTISLEKTFESHSCFQDTSFTREQRVEHHRRAFVKAIDKASESKSNADYGKLKEKFRRAFLNIDMTTSSLDDFNDALSELAEHIVKTQAVDRKAQAIIDKIRAKDYLQKNNLDTKEYINQPISSLSTRISPGKVVDAIAGIAKEAESKAGKYFHQDGFDKKVFQLDVKKYQSQIENRVYKATKDTIVEEAEKLDNALAFSLKKSINDFNKNEDIATWNDSLATALKQHKDVQKEFASAVDSTSENLFPGDEYQSLRDAIKDQFGVIQASSRAKLRESYHQRLMAHPAVIKKKITFELNEAPKRGLVDTARSMTSSFFKRLFDVQGSSLTDNERIREAIGKVIPYYENEMMATGRAIVKNCIGTAIEKRQNAGTAAGSLTEVDVENIKKETIKAVEEFKAALPNIEEIAKNSQKTLKKIPGIWDSLCKLFDSFPSRVQNGFALVLIGLGAAAITVSAIGGIALTGGIIIPVVAPILIIIGLSLLFPGCIRVFSERVKIRKTHAEVDKLIRDAATVNPRILDKIKKHIEGSMFQPLNA